MSKYITWNTELVKQKCKEFNIEFLDDKYINNKHKHNFKCKCGENFSRQWADMISNKSFFCFTCLGIKQYTLEDVRQFFNNLGYELISTEYVNINSKLTIKDNEGYYFHIIMNNMKKDITPSKFHTFNPYTIQNIKLWLKQNNRQFILLSDNFKGNHKPLQWKCLKESCGDTFIMSWGAVYNGQNCAICSGKQVGKSNNLAMKNPELSLEWHSSKNGNLTPYDITSNSNKKVWWICKECKHEWQTSVYSRNIGRGCSICNESKGEKRITTYFTINNINFTPQITYNGLIGLGNGLLSYDFYLPSYNLLIEYQGEQHEKYVKGFHKSKIDFSIQQEHDRRKREYAIKNNIKLLEIWYYNFNKIEEILNNYLI